MTSRARPLVAGVELGGTKCVCLLGTGPDDIRAEARIDTGAPDRTLAALHRILDAWKRAEGYGALGVAAFGPLQADPSAPDFGRVSRTPKPGWSGVDILAGLGDPEAPVGFDTDVNGAALAEGRWGAARGLSSYAYVTVGTGVGVGLVVQGRRLRGLTHPEAGHMRVSRPAGDDWPGACPFHGDCVEGLASGAAIAARAGAPAERLPPDHPAWEAAVQALAGLCHNLALSVSPQRILVGGGVALGQPQLIPRLRRALLGSLNGYGPAERIAADPDYVSAPALGARAGPLGALALAQAALSPVSGISTDQMSGGASGSPSVRSR